MAAPPEVTLSHLDGRYVLNKKLSDPVNGLLTLQGISWPLRKAASLAAPRTTITSSTRPEDGVLCIEIVAVVIGGLLGGGSKDNCVLDWMPMEKSDVLFGQVTWKMGWTTAAELAEIGDTLESKFLRGLILQDGSENKGVLGDEPPEERKHIRLMVESSRGGWTGQVVWGFELIDGERHYARRLTATKGDRVEMARLVYDYLGPVEV